MAITIEMPRLSDSMREGTVLRWLKKQGTCRVGDHLADIETDKAHVELQACEDGTLTEILVPEGATAAVGTPIALLQSEFGAASCDCPPSSPAVKFSPLAAKLAAEAGMDPASLHGTGPHARIMAADVRATVRRTEGPARKVQTPLAPKDTRHATRVDNFYLYTLGANMSYLAAISTPIAVQCEKLIGGRYSLFDYVVRAAVKGMPQRTGMAGGRRFRGTAHGAGQGREIRSH
ncbi:MAG: biotin/lipoyl-containing protein [Akkermansia sp.]